MLSGESAIRRIAVQDHFQGSYHAAGGATAHGNVPECLLIAVTADSRYGKASAKHLVPGSFLIVGGSGVPHANFTNLKIERNRTIGD